MMLFRQQAHPKFKLVKRSICQAAWVWGQATVPKMLVESPGELDWVKNGDV